MEAEPARSAGAPGDAAAPATAPAAKRARLAPAAGAPAAPPAAAAAPPRRVNVIEFGGKSATHEVAWPPGGGGGSPLPPPPRPGPPARAFPFALDPFQQAAVDCLEAGHSVLVAAHTSAGKTAVAEYAIGMALRDGARAVYTSPLKALSNQKFREFQEAFGDVGLMTGDTVINPGAACLVMTTEILRQMLYRGSPAVTEAALLIYDEVHYLRDPERGVVWEESIVLAPKNARFAFLSATLPNAAEFAAWVAAAHGAPVHVVATDYRPTPLEHYLFPAGADGLFQVVDARGTFREDSFSKALAALGDAESKTAAGGKGGGKGRGGGAANGGGKAEVKSDALKLAEMLMARRLDPAIVFSFSKRECDALAREMESMDLNGADEKKVVDAIFAGATDALTPADRALPAVAAALPMLRRGVGVHHSGMLPILKEATEIMFQEGLVKLLFATETFSTGLNMPARTVVFTHARKFDGGAYRWVSSGEYIQMSGRAGRRGKDARGTVVLMLDARLDPATAREMLRGAPDALRSAFHLTYGTLLAMLRVEGASPEALLRRSYAQFQAEGALPALEARAAAAAAARDAVAVEGEEAVAAYAALEAQAAELRGDARDAALAPRAALPFLQPGRLARVLPPGAARGDAGVWAAIVNFERVGGAVDAGSDAAAGADGAAGGKKKGKKAKKGGGSAASVLVDVLALAAPAPPGGRARAVPVAPGAPGAAPAVIPVGLHELAALSSVRVHLPRDLRAAEARALGARVLAEVARRFGAAGPPLLDPVRDMGASDGRYAKAAARLAAVEALLATHPLAGAPSLRARLAALARKAALGAEARAAARAARAARGLVLQEDLGRRRRVLRRLGYVDSDGLVTAKGRFAAEVSTGDSLVLTELAFSGALASLAPAAVAALLSACVWRERAEARGRPPPALEAPFGALRDAARRVAGAEADAGLAAAAEPDEYVASFRPDLMEIVAAWADGATFSHALSLAGRGTYEGSLVRALRRLDELLRQLGGAARAVGDAALAERFDAAAARIRRDVVFAPSLFL
jgi:ATP-dependent RNA helicase DOB1